MLLRNLRIVNNDEKGLRKMLQYKTLIVICFCVAITGCAIDYVKPSIEINYIALKKGPLKNSGITSYSSPFLPFAIPQEYDSYLKNIAPKICKIEEQARKIFKTEYAEFFCEVNFKNSNYYLVNYRAKTVFSDRGKIIDVVKSQDNEIVFKLHCPFIVYRYTAFVLTMNECPYLVVFAAATPRKNLSVLFILDSKFKIVYKEYLTEARRIGYAKTQKYGNCIVVETKNRWKATDNDSWKIINGEWFYYLPKEQNSFRKKDIKNIADG